MPETLSRRPITPWVDFIRVTAVYLVILAHVSGQLTNIWGQISEDQWIIADIYGGIARASVPLFFMISGYLLLPRSENLRDFYAKRVTKVLIPLVVWSLIYLGWYCGGHPNACTPSLIQDLLLVQGTSYHLWFLYSLLSIYLVLPVLRLMIRPDTDQKLLWYLIILWLIFKPTLTIANRFWNFRINISAPLATGFVCYFLLGYLLGGIALSRLKIILSIVMWSFSTLVTIVGTYLFTKSSGIYDGFFYDFVSLNVILASGAAFILLRWISEAPIFASPQVHMLTRSLATGAFGIYLIHVIVIEVLSFGIPFPHVNAFIGNAIWSVPLVGVIVFILSYWIVWVMQKIPVIKQIVP